mmetsp:Transcript_20239/g.43763  ORF Transcript_20239/g.43763 Transcript_20239/m.43763 type:complete len:714 (-) Transcript_20239:568-2709(-)
MATATTNAPSRGDGDRKPPTPGRSRVHEILDSMREQRETFLASVHPTEAEAAVKRLILTQDPPPPPPPPPLPSTKHSIAARRGPKPPLFSPIEAERITKRLNDSIRQRKERLARFSSAAEYKYRSARTTSNSDYGLRKVTSSPASITTASTEENTFFSGSQTQDGGYESDHSANQKQLPMPQHPNLEEIEEACQESESENDTASETGRAIVIRSQRDALKSEDETESESTTSAEQVEIEVEIASHSDLSASAAERTQSSKPMGAPMMTLFGYTSFEDGKAPRPPLLVTCTSNSSMRGIGDKDKTYIDKPAPATRTATCETVVSGLSNYSDDVRVGPLGPTVEERKKQLLKTLSSTMKQLGEIEGVDLQEELHSIASERRYLQKADSSSLSDAGISSVSSYSFSSDGSETSGWESNNASKLNSLPGSSNCDSLPGKYISFDPSLERRPSPLDKSFSSLSSSSYNFENPLGILPGEEEEEPKLLFTPPSPNDRKRITPDGRHVLHQPTPRFSSKNKGAKTPSTPTRVSFQKTVNVRMRTPDPEEFEEIIYPRGNLWNIAKSSGLSFGGQVDVKRGGVFRSADYIRYSAENRCASRGGLSDLAHASGMARAQIPPLKTLKMPKVNGKRSWRHKARGGLYHVAVWTRLTNNAQSPSSIFRHRDNTTLEFPPSIAANKMPKSPSELAHDAEQLRRCRRTCGAKGSFLYLCNESRRECV